MVKHDIHVDYLGLAGLFLVIEGILSIVGSQDQRVVSTVGRLTRIGIGTWIIYG